MDIQIGPTGIQSRILPDTGGDPVTSVSDQGTAAVAGELGESPQNLSDLYPFVVSDSGGGDLGCLAFFTRCR